MVFIMPVWLRNKISIISLNSYRALVSMILLFCFSLNNAAKADQAFVIQQGETLLVEGVYHINASIDYQFSEEALSALKNGVPLIILMDIEVLRERNWWWDKEIATLEQGYLLIYHALSENFIIHNLNSGTQHNYSNLAAALGALGNLENLPVLDANLLDPSAQYVVRLKTHLDIESLPAPMRPLAYISSEWQLESDWYSWSLVR